MSKKSSIEIDDKLSPMAKAIVEGLIAQPPVKERSGKEHKVAMSVVDPFADDDERGSARKKRERPTLAKSILNMLNGPKNSIERLAFEEDPSQSNQFQGLWKQKLRLLPDTVLKRIAIQDDLVAAIGNARSNQLSVYGHPRPDRFSMGFIIEPNDGVMDDFDDAKKKKLQDRIDEVQERLETCGDTKGWSDENKLTFSQYLGMSTKNAVFLGRIATEAIWVLDPQTGQKRFHSFRPMDAGTIYRAAPQKEAAEAVRQEARHLLAQYHNKRLEPERYVNDEYAWVQVIEGRPVQAFTSEECLVHNFFPVNDVEIGGYPVTPLDTVISAVTTHINITTHNKLYFQTGRATRGMLVIKSDDIDESVIARIRQQFNASINNVNNAWRMPVFGIGPEDEIAWTAIDSGQRDMEFQYLSDTNARVILSAFQMSPEELPGYAHLSRGTNNQALSESNNEYILIAHRDVGLRPLVSQWQDFLNGTIFPLLDEDLAKICTIKLVGLDAETAEKESIRIQQDAPVHMTYNEILDKVEKDPVDAMLGGDFPLNPAYQAILDKYVPVGVILERFFGMKGASQDPKWQYVRDPFYFQALQLQMQQQQMQQQAQMQQQQAAQGGPPGGGDGGGAGDGGDDGGSGGGPPGGGGGGGGDEGSQSADAQSAQAEDQVAAQNASADLTRSVDQASALLSKGEKQLPPSKQKLLAQHRSVVKHVMRGWTPAKEAALNAILDVAEKHAPKGE